MGGKSSPELKTKAGLLSFMNFQQAFSASTLLAA
jgi:hypothetical protein